MSSILQDGFLNLPKETKAEYYKEFYCNFSRVNVTPYDITVTFGRLNSFSKVGEPLEVIMETAVTASPYQFKVYVNSLSLILAQWEKQFGEINLNSDLLMRQETVEEMSRRNVSGV